MTKEEKVNIVEKLAEKFDKNDCFYIADASGLTVEQINAFRRLCFQAGVEYGVYKNTLIRKALEQKGVDSEVLFEVLRGFSGVMFSKETGNAPARIIQDYRKKKKGKPLLKIASINTDLYVGDDSLDALSQLKSKDEIIGDIIAILQSPAKNVLSALLSGQNKIAGVVKTLAEKTK